MSTADDTPCPPAEKLCSKCQALKPLAAFQRDRQRPDGYYPWCKACRKASYERRKDRVNAVRRARRADNPEPIRQATRAGWHRNKQKYNRRRRELRQTDPAFRTRVYDQQRKCNARRKDKVRATNRRNYLARRDERIEYQRKWNAANADRMRERAIRYRAANPHKCAALNAKRKSRERELPFDLTEADIAHAVAYWGGACAICKVPFGRLAKLDLDHWQPISSPVCPGTVPQNMLPLCHKCNRRKKDKDPLAWVTRDFGADAPALLRKIDEFFRSVSRVRPWSA